MSRFLYENHWGSLTLTLLNVLNMPMDLLSSIISPHTKFHPNQTENTEVENLCCWSVLVGHACRSKNGRSHFKLVLCRFCSVINPIPNFIQNRRKIQTFLLFVGIDWSGWYVEKWLQPFQTRSMWLLVDYQPPCQISSNADRQHRS